MKKCTYCGKNFPDETQVCPLDHQQLAFVSSALDPSESPQTIPGLSPDRRYELLHAANESMIVGGALCVIGFVVTAVTYWTATPGGIYFIAWGAVLFGAIRFVRGLAARQNIGR